MTQGGCVAGLRSRIAMIWWQAFSSQQQMLASVSRPSRRSMCSPAKACKRAAEVNFQTHAHEDLQSASVLQALSSDILAGCGQAHQGLSCCQRWPMTKAGSKGGNMRAVKKRMALVPWCLGAAQCAAAQMPRGMAGLASLSRSTGKA